MGLLSHLTPFWDKWHVSRYFHMMVEGNHRKWKSEMSEMESVSMNNIVHRVTFSSHPSLRLQVFDQFHCLTSVGKGIQDLIQSRIALLLIQKRHQLVHTKIRLLLCATE